MSFLQFSPSNKIVAQHNHFLNGHYNFNVHELRIFIYMLLCIKKGDKDFCGIRIPCDELQPQNITIHYEQIKEACNSMVEKSVKVETIDKNGKKTYRAIPLIAYCEYREGGGYLEARFNDYVRPFLLNLTDNFTTAQWQEFMNITNSYSFRMYWLLKQYQDFGRREFNIVDLRSLLGLDKKSYPQYTDFRKRVINPIQKSLSGMDMAFDYQEIRKSRAIKSIIFTFAHKRPQKNRSVAAPPPAAAVAAPSQMSLPLEEAVSGSRYDQLLLKYGFNAADLDQLKEIKGESTYNRMVYYFETNMLPGIHPKDVRAELMKLFS